MPTLPLSHPPPPPPPQLLFPEVVSQVGGWGCEAGGLDLGVVSELGFRAGSDHGEGRGAGFALLLCSQLPAPQPH